MGDFTPLASLAGGFLIGLSAALMLVLHGRVAGITGVVSGALDPMTAFPERVWRLAFAVRLGRFARNRG